MVIFISFFVGIFLGSTFVYFSALDSYKQAKFYKRKYYDLSDQYNDLLYKFELSQGLIHDYEKRFGVDL